MKRHEKEKLFYVMGSFQTSKESIFRLRVTPYGKLFEFIINNINPGKTYYITTDH